MSEELNLEEVTADRGWAFAEFGEISLPDKRLEDRAINLAEELSAHPQVSINNACKDWNAVKAAYRFFRNGEVDCSALLAPHKKNTIQRSKASKTVLAIQDSSFLNFGHSPCCKELGPIGSGHGNKGLILHNTLMLTPEGAPLGLLDQKKTVRSEPKRETRQQRRDTPITEKESYRWIEALREAAKLQSKDNRVVTVCDREGDIYEFFQEACSLGTYFLVRASHPRKSLDSESLTVFESVASERPAGSIKVKIPSRAGQKARIAELDVRYRKLTLKPAYRRKAGVSVPLEPLEVWMVMVEEANPPKGIPALSWTLISNVEVASFEDAKERISWYTARWHIEVYHKVFKSGCKVEDCRLESVEALKRYLTLFGIIAWRIYWLTHFARVEPNANPNLILADSEIEALEVMANKKKTRVQKIPKKKRKPIKIDCVRTAVREIAKLAGFNARKGDGEPGPKLVWMGMQKLSCYTEVYEEMVEK